VEKEYLMREREGERERERKIERERERERERAGGRSQNRFAFAQTNLYIKHSHSLLAFFIQLYIDRLHDNLILCTI
jgi:hypothetical protein